MPLIDANRPTTSSVGHQVALSLERDDTFAIPHAISSASIVLSAVIARRFSALAEDANATPAAALLAAWGVLLFRLTDDPELVIATPAACVAGVCLRVGRAHSFRDTIGQAHEALSAVSVSAVRARANVAFFADAGPPNDAGAALDLALSFAHDPGGLRCTFSYAAASFERATVERWLDSFARLIHEVINAPDAPIARLPMLGAAESALVLREWNPTPSRDASEGTLRGRFESHAARDPGAIAVISDDERLNYGDLNARANQLARAIRARGIDAGDVVAFACERNVETIVIMLAIVKTGAAYLPIDLSYPPERIRFMIGHAGARALVTRGPVAVCRSEFAAPTACIDLATLDLEAYPPIDLPDAGTADDLAYVMYTSGTTGRPKGVLVPQRGIINLVTATPALAIDTCDRVAQLANISFDAATYEIWGALLNGARLVIGARETTIVPENLAVWLRENRISVAFVTSALLHHISGHAPAAFATLRCLIAGGDVVDPQSVRSIYAHGPPQRFLNGYGPTETTTFATTFDIVAPGVTPIPIGRPLANVQAYILDAQRDPVPIGVTGDLYVGGVGVALGYVNDPELTARAFVRHPFSPDPRARLYATGDLARFRADGTIEFLGRRDRQVKIRGYRVEIDEIAAAIRSVPGVADAVIHIAEDQPGDKRIVAYVVHQDGLARRLVQWRTELAQRLPDYMLPNTVIVVPTIPLSPNGKIDMSALVDAQRVHTVEAPAAGEPPRTAAEASLATIIATVLGVASVDPKANFFALGGHSLLAMRALTRIREHFGVTLALRDFFAEPTVAALADRVADAPLPSTPRSDARLVDAACAIPLSAAQHRLWLLDELEPGTAAYNVPYAFRLTGPLDRDVLERALEGVAQRHAVLRSTISVIAGEPAYVVHEHRLPDLAFRTVESDAQLDAALLRERERPFDLRADLPMRALVVRRAAGDHVLLVTMHHIATDGWSMGIFKRELSALYATGRNERAPLLDELTASYAHFAQAERDGFGSPAFGDRLAYWSALLHDVPPPLELGAQRAPCAWGVPAGRLRSRLLTRATRDALQRFCRAHGTTEFSTLFAAFAVLLHGMTDRRDFIVGTVVANRTRTAFEGLVGFFVNTLALRVTFAGDPAFAALLAQFQRATLDAFDHQDVPFQKVVELVNPPRSGTRAPLLNAMFVMQNAPDDALALVGLDVAPVWLERTTAKFDLTLEVTADASGGLNLGFEYRTDRFDAGEIDLLLRRLEHIVDAALAEPDRPLSLLAAQTVRTPQLRTAPLEHRSVQVNATERPFDANGATEVHVALRDLWEQLLGVAPIGIHDNFFDLGGHSLIAVRLIGAIEAAFHLRLPLSLLFEQPTIDGFARAIGAGAGVSSADPIVTYNAHGTKRPLYFLHGSIGGGGFYCRAIAERLGADRPLHVVRPHGAAGERLPPSIEAIALETIALIKARAPHGPYLLGGYCAGGLVAFEMARRLRAAGERVAAVILIDVPDAPRTLRGVVEGIDRAGALLRVEERQRRRISGALARLPHHRARLAASSSKRDFVAQHVRRLIRTGRSPGGTLRPAQTALADWIRLTEAYVPRRYDGRIALLLTRPDGLSSADDRAGWASLASRVDLQRIAGTHLTCITDHLDDTARAVAAVLADEA